MREYLRLAMAIAFLAGLAAAAELWATRNYGADHPGACQKA